MPRKPNTPRLDVDVGQEETDLTHQISRAVMHLDLLSDVIELHIANLTLILLICNCLVSRLVFLHSSDEIKPCLCWIHIPVVIIVQFEFVVPFQDFLVLTNALHEDRGDPSHLTTFVDDPLPPPGGGIRRIKNGDAHALVHSKPCNGLVHALVRDLLTHFRGRFCAAEEFRRGAAIACLTAQVPRIEGSHWKTAPRKITHEHLGDVGFPSCR
mmetsp:Transcript_34904/g.55905  ORF Transcript_34904/g.55905 Transcript_34904/m.55905 type:complete len:212 (+) Transcript_34904:471-1106(+)